MSRLGKPRPSHRKIQHQRAVIRAGKGLVLRNGAGEQALRRDEGVIDVVGAIEMPVQIKGRHALASLLLPLRLMPGGNETGLLHHPHHRRMRALAVLGIPSAIAVEVADDDAALVDLLAVNAVVLIVLFDVRLRRPHRQKIPRVIHPNRQEVAAAVGHPRQPRQLDAVAGKDPEPPVRKLPRPQAVRSECALRLMPAALRVLAFLNDVHIGAEPRDDLELLAELAGAVPRNQTQAVMNGRHGQGRD